MTCEQLPRGLLSSTIAVPMSQSAIQTVLLIEELAERIISYTFERPLPRAPAKSCKTLLALARVNRAFSEMALRQLWLSLESVQPLLSLLTPMLQQLLMPWIAKTIPAKKVCNQSLEIHWPFKLCCVAATASAGKGSHPLRLLLSICASFGYRPDASALSSCVREVGLPRCRIWS